jgi:hypothetical protein
MSIRHTVVFTFYESTSENQKQEVILRLNDMGRWLVENVGVTNWIVAEHIPDTFKEGRAHLLQDCVFPSVDALGLHAETDVHKRVVELTREVCDWMTVDTIVGEADHSSLHSL